MIAFLDDAAGLHDDDLVGIDHGGQPVSNDDRRAALHDLFQRVLHQLFGIVVERRSRLVEQQDRRVAHDGAGDRQALTLAAGKRNTVFADRRVVTLRLGEDEILGIGEAGGFLDLGIGGIGTSVADVVADRPSNR
jgi:hypothetical protein